MAEAATKLAVKTEEKKPAAKTSLAPAIGEAWPFSNLRREIDRLFDDFMGVGWRSPFHAPLAKLNHYGVAI